MTRRHTPPLRHFGRRAPPVIAVERASDSSTVSNELRLFALTFAGGFLFMTVFLA